MSELRLTPHAIVRMSQRSIGRDDIDLIVAIGIEVRGGYFVRTKDVEAFVNKRKRECERARRLEGTLLVVENGAVVTTYHARKSKERGLLQGGRNGGRCGKRRHHQDANKPSETGAVGLSEG